MAKTKGSHGSSGGTVAVVARLAEPIAEELGLLLWDIRFVKEGASWILRLVIDREDRPVSIDDCVDLSRRINPLLDEADPIPQSYCLEVTSPGAERELTRPEHFVYYEGLPVTVRLYRPRDGVKEFAGLLIGRDANGAVTLEEEDGTRQVFEKAEYAAVHAIDCWEDDPDDLDEPETDADI